jgi:hypothetical protein
MQAATLGEIVFDTIGGLPLHPLVVHAVVILMPLTAIAVIAFTFRPALNRKYGWIICWLAFFSMGAAALAKESGERLATRVGFPTEHIAIARWTPYVAGVFFLLTLALWWYDRKGDDRRSGAGSALAIAAMVMSFISIYWAVRAGHSGAEAVWNSIIKHTTPGTYPKS